jgi:ribosome recycling factor
MTDDEKLKRIYQKIFTDAMVYGENYPMQMVAATYLAIAMRLYKTILNEEEYKEMLKAIMESAENVQPYKDPKKTLH